MARVMLVLSSLTACLLLAGSLTTLVGAPVLSLPRGLPELTEFGHVLLLIFWSVFGWEVLGNYVAEVDNPARTMLCAMRISLAGIVSVYLLTAFALQNAPAGGMPGLLVPILGAKADPCFWHPGRGLVHLHHCDLHGCGLAPDNRKATDPNDCRWFCRGRGHLRWYCW